MQPTFKKYGLKKIKDSLPNSIDPRNVANAGKVSSWNVSESGGGDIKSIAMFEKSTSQSPIRNEELSSVNLKKKNVQINPIHEEVSD